MDKDNTGDGFSVGEFTENYKLKSYINKQGEGLNSDENIALLYKVVLKTSIGSKTEEKVLFEF